MPGSTATQLGNFQDPYDYTIRDAGKIVNPNSFGSKFSDWLGTTNRAGDYEAWMDADARNYERANINSARAWEEYLDSTKYQRMTQDLEKAGLNPWLALQSGASASASGSTSSSGGSASSGRSVSRGNGAGAKNALLGLAAIAKIVSLLV